MAQCRQSRDFAAPGAPLDAIECSTFDHIGGHSDGKPNGFCHPRQRRRSVRGASDAKVGRHEKGRNLLCEIGNWDMLYACNQCNQIKLISF
jgi:hypothetical protein